MLETILLYHRQHERALECASEVLSELSGGKNIEDKSQAIRMALARLAGVLRPHLHSEDSLLYPVLIANKDPEISAMAQRYWDEMGNLNSVVSKYLNKWRTFGAVEASVNEFENESRTVFEVLKTRITSEEKVLYPMFLRATQGLSSPLPDTPDDKK